MQGSTTGLLAAWASAYLQQSVSIDDAIERVLGHKSSVVVQSSHSAERAPWDEPPRAGRLLEPGEQGTLTELLVALRKRGVPRVQAAFPIAGDAGGVGPGPALVPAYHAGGAVLVEPLDIVIVATDEDADQIELTLFESKSRTQYVSVAEASVELSEAIHRSSSILTELDVASWNPRLGRVSRRGMDQVTVDELPPDCPARAHHLLARAHQVLSLLDAAASDPGGGSVSSHEANARDAALAPLRRHAARALSAAYNSLPYE